MSGRGIVPDAVVDLAARKRELVARLLQKQGLDPSAEAIPRLGGGAAPLSFAQQRLWFLERLLPGNPLYNISGAIRLEGVLDRAALERSLGQILLRHEVLRTTLQDVDGEPRRRLAPPEPVSLPPTSLESLTESARAQDVVRRAREEAALPFDLCQGPLYRFQLLGLGPQQHVLLFTLHHVVADGWSVGVFLRELGLLYGALHAGRPSPLSELPLQYGDFAAWQRASLEGPARDEQLGYWRRHLEGAPAALDLPTDHPRSPVPSLRGARVERPLAASLGDGLRALGRGEHASLYMVLLAGFQLLLHRYSGQPRVVVGVPSSGRTRTELEGLIGLFVNTLVMQADFTADPTVLELVRQVRRSALGADAHQDLPFEQLVEELRPDRDTSRTPLFQAAFAFQQPQMAASDLGEAGLRVRPVGIESDVAKFELTFYLTDSPRGLTAAAEYATDLFEPATVARMLGHYERILEEMVSRPEARVSELPLLGGDERRRVLVEWNATTTVPAGKAGSTRHLVHEAFSARAGIDPMALAVAGRGEQWSYRVLEERSNRWARLLRERGVGPDVRVGLCVGAGPGWVMGALAVLKAGGAYVAIDPELPEERLAYVLRDSGAVLVLTESSLEAKVAGIGVSWLDLDGHEADDRDGAPIASTVRGDNLAYVIYTSGSTGVPKGVELTHTGLLNLVEWHVDRYGVSPSDRATQVAGLGFDASVWELWPYLARGASVHVPEGELRTDPKGLREWLASEGITLCFLPTPLAEMMLGESWPEGGRLRALLTGGDRLRTFPERGLGFEVVNHYGPTENTVVATAGVAEPGLEGAPTIGRPISNVRVYLLDGRMEPVPPGVLGEMYLGGRSLARGYLGRPDMTAGAFVPDPFSETGGERLYRTGDVCRYRGDGSIEFVGRADHQVKVRGHRIELQEIEAVLARQVEVKQAVVLVREDGGGERRLVAYVVPAEGMGSVSGRVRERLRESLPEYMVPTRWVELSELPLNANGKVDQGSLPEGGEKGLEEARSGVLELTATEEMVGGIFGEVLGVRGLGVGDRFFDLGGHSLLATRVVSRVEEAFGRTVPLRWLFETPTVGGFAERLDREVPGRPVAPALRARTRQEGDGAGGERLETSYGQQRMWLLQEMEPGGTKYHVAGAVKLSGELKVEVLGRALEEVVRRHEVLRTRFEREGGRIVQVVEGVGSWGMGFEDFEEGLGSRVEGKVKDRVSELWREPFDLSKGGLFRATVLRVSEREHVLVLVMHHVVSDGWSLGVLVKEVGELYGAQVEGRAPGLRELEVQYGDYAEWQRGWLSGEVLEEQVSYWRGRLTGAPRALEVPTDRRRGEKSGGSGGRGEKRVSSELVEKLRGLSRREGVTLFMVMLGAFQGVLSRWSGQLDVVVGSPIAGRTRKEIEGLIGFFVNTLVLRTDLSGHPTVRELMGRVREVCLGAYAHQDLPFEKLVEELNPERTVGHHPLFQVMFVLQNAPVEALKLPGLTLSSQEVEDEGGPAKFDLMLMGQEGPSGLRLSLSYDRDLFDEKTIERLLAHYERMLEGFVGEPEGKVGEIPLLSESERQQVVSEWNLTKRPYPEKGIGEVFSEVAALRAETVAVVCGKDRLTYRELEERSNRLGNYLRNRGVRVGSRVGICVERSLELVVGLLGIVKAGAAYVPLDPSYPKKRLEFLVRDSEVEVLLTQETLKGALGEGVLSGRDVVCLDSGWSEIGKESEKTPGGGAVVLEDLAYVTYTSGSTGQPKGVEVTHRGVMRLLFESGYAEFGPEQVFLQLAPVTFDASTFEIWGALLHGGRLVLYPGRVPTAGELGEVLRGEGVTTLWLTSSLYNAVVEEEAEALWGVKQLLIGGEALSVSHVRKGLERLPKTRIINGYGPTESTTFACCYEIPRELGEVRSISIGRPIGNTRAYVLDGRMEPVAVGVTGELYLGGDGLARGYLKRAELTAEKFVPDPFSEAEGKRLYRTGDVVRYLSDGRIEFVGRVDEQVKVRGYRIELQEIESVLLGHPLVSQGVVVVREDTPGDKRLVAYVVWGMGSGEEEGRVSGLREHLRGKLPEYMVPGTYVALLDLPRTVNGKVDHRGLPIPEGRAERAVAYVAPSNEVERTVVGVWKEVLQTETVGLHDNFFDLGGHSLLLVQLHEKLKTRFPHAELQLLELFELPTAQAQAVRLAQASAAPSETRKAPAASDAGQGRQRLARRREARAKGEAQQDPAQAGEDA